MVYPNTTDFYLDELFVVSLSKLFSPTKSFGDNLDKKEEKGIDESVHQLDKNFRRGMTIFYERMIRTIQKLTAQKLNGTIENETKMTKKLSSLISRNGNVTLLTSETLLTKDQIIYPK